jgi:hypothetical protein
MYTRVCTGVERYYEEMFKLRKLNIFGQSWTAIFKFLLRIFVSLSNNDTCKFSIKRPERFRIKCDAKALLRIKIQYRYSVMLLLLSFSAVMRAYYARPLYQYQLRIYADTFMRHNNNNYST